MVELYFILRREQNLPFDYCILFQSKKDIGLFLQLLINTRFSASCC